MGTYGQFALGTAAAIINTGWLGYARVDYKVGEDIEGWSVNAGLRYQFTPEQRGGIKDAPRRLPHVQLDGSLHRWFAGAPGATSVGSPASGQPRDVPDFRGYLGGQAGYNLQVGRFVYGIEADYGWSNAEGGKLAGVATRFFFTCEAEVDGLAS